MNRRRTKREKIMLVILLILLGLYILKSLFISPYILKMRQLKSNIAEINKKLNSLEAGEKEYLALKKDYERLKEDKKIYPVEYLEEKDLEKVFQSFMETEGQVYGLKSWKLIDREGGTYNYELEFFGDLEIIEENLVFIDQKYKNLCFISKELRRLDNHKELKNYLVSLEMKLYP